MRRAKQVIGIVLGTTLMMSIAACGDNNDVENATGGENEAAAAEENVNNEAPEVDEDEIVMQASRAYFNTLPEGSYMMSADDVYEALDDVVILDIRADGDFAEEAIAGAMNIPMAQLGTSFDEIPSDEKVVVVCYSGQTASQAMAVLRMAGYDTYIATGGMNGWNSAELPVE
ncbi:rhodanese-like domain-containing protein [Salisediminibacterium beveridgei]|uniref:Rhodanese Domain-Containing Protein n=1 Tax=Salisediminibacterium beveridgei TaxID=632773 RepID=A0A1D7QTP1_9BACI|nr:rhodanese-like domain-containing protein [Salisediminibacterium beveridgei]AOM82384.1 Rhodanese Domain-Containing Protein [Salisediminibacterium beveridgei]